MIEETATLLIKHEGYEQYKYIDSVGVETIGIGFNLDYGFTLEECKLVLNSRIENLDIELSKRISFYTAMPESIRSVLINMAYNLGIAGLLKFRNMLGYLKSKEYLCASIEMLDSKWAKQVGPRAIELSEIVNNEAP